MKSITRLFAAAAMAAPTATPTPTPPPKAADAKPLEFPASFKSDEQTRSMTFGYDVYTKESIVEKGGTKFRQVEFKGEKVYLRLLENESSAGNLEIICGEQGFQKYNASSPALIQGSIKVTKRSSLFVEGLKQACVSGNGGKPQLVVDPALQVGFLLDDQDPKAIFKNKRITVNPLMWPPQLGFGAEW